jgi:hypothetical protein
MFEFTGDKGVFRPASCKAEMRNVVLRAVPVQTRSTYDGYLWWISGTSVAHFDIVRDGKSVAEFDASVVLHVCYAATHCVFKLPMQCGNAKKTHVFGHTASGKKKAETFVLC